MMLYCPYCTKEIAPQIPQCPFCGTPYGVETLLLLKNLVREALVADPDEPSSIDQACYQEGAGVGH
jgi:hypothetical protein